MHLHCFCFFFALLLFSFFLSLFHLAFAAWLLFSFNISYFSILLNRLADQKNLLSELNRPFPLSPSVYSLIQSFKYCSTSIVVAVCIFIALNVVLSRGNLYVASLRNISIIAQNKPYPFYSIITSHC